MLLRTEELANRWGQLLETLPDAFVGVDESGTIRLFNRQAEVLFGWQRDAILGAPVERLIPTRYHAKHPGLRTGFVSAPTTRPMGMGRELSARRADGSEFPAEVSLSAMDTAEGRIVSVVVRDVTERLRAEAAERANLAKSEFLSRMSHELRTPLNAILGFAQLLELDDLSVEQADNVHQILKGGRHLLDLVNEVLDIARIESGRLSISIEPVAVEDVVAECIDLVRHAAGRREIAIGVQKSGLPLMVDADRQRLKQVLVNLLSNAVKYNRDAGRITVGWAIVSGRAAITVTDTGHGIAPDKLDRVFVAFDRLGAEQTGIEGVGLGLALSRRLTEAMGGDLCVTSELDVGTTFTIDLALIGEAASDLLNHDDPAGHLPEVPAGPIGRVLYIEDNDPNIRLVERILARRPGVELLTATHGRLGLEIARSAAPNLIVLDVNLPDVDGGEVLDELKGSEATRDIPVVVASADATGAQINRLLASGALEYLTKPLDVRRFLEVVDSVLGLVEADQR